MRTLTEHDYLALRLKPRHIRAIRRHITAVDFIETTCWEWHGTWIGSTAVLGVGKRRWPIRRLLVAKRWGRLPPGYLKWSCPYRARCVNPDHLDPRSFGPPPAGQALLDSAPPALRALMEQQAEERRRHARMLEAQGLQECSQGHIRSRAERACSVCQATYSRAARQKRGKAKRQ